MITTRIPAVGSTFFAKRICNHKGTFWRSSFSSSQRQNNTRIVFPARENKGVQRDMFTQQYSQEYIVFNLIVGPIRFYPQVDTHNGKLLHPHHGGMSSSSTCGIPLSPIPAFPPYYVRHLHMHGAPTLQRYQYLCGSNACAWENITSVFEFCIM